MIWHFVEVWLFVLLTFLVGCLAGAHLYGYLAETRLANAQGAVADTIGDLVDGLKARIGLAPAWRPAQMRRVERALPPLPVPEPEMERESELILIEAPQDQEPLRVEEALELEAPVAPLPPPRTLRPLPPPVRSTDSDLVVVKAKPQRALVPPISPQRPAGLSGPRGGVPDNLQRIKGIGRRNEHLLNELGVFHFGQIAAWTPAEAAWIGQYLAFPDRIARDDWVGQATLLAMGTGSGFQKSAERRRERRRQQREFQERMANASAGVEEDDPYEAGYDDDLYQGGEDESVDYEDAPHRDDEFERDGEVRPAPVPYDAGDDPYDHDGPVEDAVLLEPDDFDEFIDDDDQADDERR